MTKNEELKKIKELGFYLTRSYESFYMKNLAGGEREATAQEVTLWFNIFSKTYTVGELRSIGAAGC